MGAGASVALDPSTLNSSSVVARRETVAGAGDDERVAAYKELEADIAYENGLLLDFTAKRDVLTVKYACAGMGTDETALTRVICGRTKRHLDIISTYYKEAHGKTLLEQIGAETGGNLAKMLSYRLMTPVQFRAKIVDAAMDGFGCDENLLTETLCHCSNAEIMELREVGHAWAGACG